MQNTTCGVASTGWPLATLILFQKKTKNNEITTQTLNRIDKTFVIFNLYIYITRRVGVTILI